MLLKVEDYYQIEVLWRNGFKHNIYCRGYGLKSMINFQKTIYWIASAEYKQITEKQYNKAQHDNGNTNKEKRASGRTKAGASDAKRNSSGGNNKQSRLKARNSTGNRSTGNAGKCG